jgi:hypothetical protein
MSARGSAGTANRMQGHPICKGVSETCCFGVTAFRKGCAATALPSHCCPTATDFCGALCYIQSHWLPVLPVGGDGTDTGRWGAKARFRGGNRAFSRLVVRKASRTAKRPSLTRAVLDYRAQCWRDLDKTCAEPLDLGASAFERLGRGRIGHAEVRAETKGRTLHDGHALRLQ